MIEINKHSSYKLYWIDFPDSRKEEILNILKGWNLRVLDVGFELAKILKDKTPEDTVNNIAETVTFLFDNYLNVNSTDGIPYVIITNIGFILEPFLMIDPVRFLKAYSKNTGVVLLWDGSVRDNSLFYWQSNPEFTINFADTNIKKIDLLP